MFKVPTPEEMSNTLFDKKIVSVSGEGRFVLMATKQISVRISKNMSSRERVKHSYFLVCGG